MPNQCIDDFKLILYLLFSFSYCGSWLRLLLLISVWSENDYRFSYLCRALRITQILMLLWSFNGPKCRKSLKSMLRKLKLYQIIPQMRTNWSSMGSTSRQPSGMSILVYIKKNNSLVSNIYVVHVHVRILPIIWKHWSIFIVISTSLDFLNGFDYKSIFSFDVTNFVDQRFFYPSYWPLSDINDWSV